MCVSKLRNAMAGNVIHYERNIRSSQEPASIRDTPTVSALSLLRVAAAQIGVTLHYRGLTSVTRNLSSWLGQDKSRMSYFGRIYDCFKNFPCTSHEMYLIRSVIFIFFLRFIHFPQLITSASSVYVPSSMY